MDRKTAEALLAVGDGYDAEKIKGAYLDRVKEARNTPEFEDSLRQLNVARDTLLDMTSASRELVPVLATQIAAISARQNQLALLNDAKDEIRSTFGAIERRSVNQLKGTRDLTGILSAISAALVFGKDNFSELFPSLAETTLYSQTLLLMSACFAFMAFMANRRASTVSTRLDEINQHLTRERQISRLLGRVFADQDRLSEEEFEDRLAFEIRLHTGASREPSAIGRALDMYGAIGMPVPVRIHLGRGFTDDYIDFLIKAGHIKPSGTSGRDMVIHRSEQP